VSVGGRIQRIVQERERVARQQYGETAPAQMTVAPQIRQEWQRDHQMRRVVREASCKRFR
jgi:hypothetical protein